MPLDAQERLDRQQRLLSAIRDAVRFPFHDPIHKRIWLTEAELRVVDTSAFQRLRRISQLGLADYVFPGATRSRFSHSLGALYVMSRLLGAAKGRIAEELTYGDGTIEGASGITWPRMRMAALLHDIGHLPFSHPTEQVYGRLEEEARLGPENVAPGGPNDLLDQVAIRYRPRGANHEAFSQIVLLAEGSEIGQTLETQLGAGAATEIVELIRGISTRSAVASALLSSALDADRLDFVMRDSDSAGFSYGAIDLDYLVENADISTLGGTSVFTIDARHGLGPLEHYLAARNFIYSQLVHHKTVAAAELLLRAVLLAAARESVIPEKVEDVRSRFENGQWHELTDGWFLSRLSESRDDVHVETRGLIDRLLARHLPKVAYADVRLASGGVSDDLSQLMRSRDGKREVAERASQKLRAAYGLTVLPNEFCYTERPQDLVEVDAPDADRPKAALLGYPDGTAAAITDEKNSLFAILQTYQRHYRYVFVLDDRSRGLRVKPKADAIAESLRDMQVIG